MPLYEYKCLKCGRRTEKIESVAGPHLKKCPHCGGKVESVVTAPSIQFKGSGWYVTDYSGKSKSDAGDGDKPEKPAVESKEAGGKEAAGKESTAKEAASNESSSKEKKATKKK